MQKKYAEEAKNLYCETDEYNEYTQKTMNYNQNDWVKIGKDVNSIFESFADAMDKGVESSEVQALVKNWQDFITKNFYNCTQKTLSDLGKLYIQDERFAKNINKHKAGLAEFVSEAIDFYCK